MSKRTKAATAIITGLGAAALLRKAGLRTRAVQIVIKARDAVVPPRPAAAHGEDVAHAPGHRHLPLPEAENPPEGAEHGSYTIVSHHPGHVHKG